MAAVLIIMAVMAIFLTVAVQTATFQKQRENEEELIFRGNQMIEAVRLFRARNGRFPVTLKELWEADPRVMRKEWKDPITGKFDWVPVFLGQDGEQLPGSAGVVPTPPPSGEPGDGSGEGTTDPWGGEGGFPGTGFGAGQGERKEFPPTDASGPIIGVHSRSCDEAIKLLEGRSQYCDWKFALDPKKQPGGEQPEPGRTPRPRRTPRRSR